jgi:hypothetical protein
MIDEEIIGLDVHTAVDMLEEAGLTYRIEHEDGQSYMLTMDVRMDRINLSIKNGMVIGSRRG